MPPRERIRDRYEVEGRWLSRSLLYFFPLRLTRPEERLLNRYYLFHSTLLNSTSLYTTLLYRQAVACYWYTRTILSSTELNFQKIGFLPCFEHVSLLFLGRYDLFRFASFRKFPKQPSKKFFVMSWQILSKPSLRRTFISFKNSQLTTCNII